MRAAAGPDGAGEGREALPRDSGRFVAGHVYSTATQFQPGKRSSPLTELKKGQRLSPATEFKPGQAAHNKLPVGAETVRVFRGTARAWVKVAEPNKWRERAKVVWERANGRAVPRGYVIHHKDRDSLNDDPGNLVALTRSEHAREHEHDLKRARFGSDGACT